MYPTVSMRLTILAVTCTGSAVIRDLHGHRAMQAFCELTPSSPVLLEEMERFRLHLSANGEWLICSSFDMALVCTAGTSQEVFFMIRFLLRGCPSESPLFCEGVLPAHFASCAEGFRLAKHAVDRNARYIESKRTRQLPVIVGVSSGTHTRSARVVSC